ncbi:MAG: transposase [Actinobacteria bacterium]|nr:transposase [Actinomycetota bacterium]
MPASARPPGRAGRRRVRVHAPRAGHRPRQRALRQAPRHDRTVFANTKLNRRIDRFQRRGRSAARSEWRLITATHNLLKLHKQQTALAAS